MKTRVRIPALLLVLMSAAAVVAQEKSVKPGINKKYEDANVEGSVKQFEGKNREIVQNLDKIVEACQLKPGMNVADVGAGTGLLSRPFAEKVRPEGKVYAVDISEKFLRHIEKTCKEKGINNVAGVLGKPTSTELEPKSVDLVFTCDTYHHFEYPFKMLASIHKSLRSGGRLIIIDFVKKEGVSPKWVMGHVRADKDMVIKEATEAGFKFIDEVEMMKSQYVVRFEKVD